MTGHERIAAGNIRQCFNFEVGGVYNAYLDGETDFPTLEEMKDMIYTLAMNDRYSGGCCYVDCAPRDLNCTLKEKKFLNNYGCYCYGFDYNGNCLSWVTEKDLEFEEGDAVTLTGTVKSHKVFAGNKTTYLNRCIVK